MFPDHLLNIVVVGGGGREHALCWKLSQSVHVNKIFCVPGNGGTATTNKVTNVDLKIMDFAGIARLGMSVKADLVVIGPDNALSEGIVDYLEEVGLRVFGPNQRASRLEWSKGFAKEFMRKANIPTARFALAKSLAEAEKAYCKKIVGRV